MRARWVLAAACALLLASANAAEVRVLAAGAAKAAVERIAPEFERATGDSINATFDTVGALRDRIIGGEKPDLVLLSAAAVDTLAQRGLIAADSRREIGSVVAGLAVRAGAPAPDIESVDALKRSLLAAKSVAHADGARGATSGAHFASVVEALGLRDQLAGRITVLPFGVDVVQGVADGKFEVGVSQSGEILPVPGVTFVGGLPAPYALRTLYAAAVVGSSEAGLKLLRWLESPAAQVHLRAAGFSRP